MTTSDRPCRVAKGRGRPPKPTALKLLHGNPGHRAIPKDEPKPRVGKPTCPDWVCDAGKALWNAKARDLIREGLLTERSQDDFASWCQEMAIYAIYSELLKTLKATSTRVERYRAIALKARDRSLRIGAKFGMTPADQVGLKVPATTPDDDGFLFGHAQR